MKTKLLAMMLLAGGSMFAQTRFSVGIGFGGQGAGFYQPPPSYASNIPPRPGPDYTWVDGYWSQNYGRNTWVAGYWNRQPFSNGYQVAPRFDNRSFDNRSNDGDDDDRQSFTRGFEQDRNRGFDEDRNFSGQDHNQARGFNQGQTRDFGQNQNQNQDRGNRNRSIGHDDRQGSGYVNGFRGR
jgi:hypothetical protein